ncbi:MAG: polyprenyl diphosphate synthase, partial [Halobacteriovoraceae bacterium]|nr:polyprenyl diphosphate synthase [Halobacteriovoraceae bacterium]
MDGNGRWAEKRKHQRLWGHIRGSSVVSKIVEEAQTCNIRALTFYAFSTENWYRPSSEINVLFNLLQKYLIREEQRILKNNIRFRIMGEIKTLPAGIQKSIIRLEDLTKSMTGLKLTFAFSHGGRNEIVWAANNFMKKNPGVPLTLQSFSQSLMIPDLGDVDLLIRTGGDFRISNFLLWQSAYAELYFTSTKWPDFGSKEFRRICEKVQTRERR